MLYGKMSSRNSYELKKKLKLDWGQFARTATRCIAGDRQGLLHYCPFSGSAVVNMGMDTLIEPYNAQAMTYHP